MERFQLMSRILKQYEKEQRENDENRQRNHGLHAEEAKQRKPNDEGEWTKNNSATMLCIALNIVFSFMPQYS